MWKNTLNNRTTREQAVLKVHNTKMQLFKKKKCMDESNDPFMLQIKQEITWWLQCFLYSRMGPERGSNIQQWNNNNTSFVLDENLTHILYRISLNLTEHLQQ